MTNFWSLEGGRLVWLFAAILAVGLLTGYWVVAVALPSAIYISFMLYQLYRLNRWFSVGLVPAEAPDGEGLWAELVQNIFRAQDREEKRKKRLKEMLARFNATVAALPDATVVLNEHMEIEWANEPARLLLGVDRVRDGGLRLRNLIRKKEFIEYLSQDGSPPPLEIASPVDPQIMLLLQVVGFGKGQKLLLARDISQRIEAQRSRKAFVDNASHELKSPLTVIKGYLELIQMSPDLPEPLREPVNRAEEQAEHMHHIIQDLLTLSRLEEHATVTAPRQRVSVAEVIESIIQHLQKSGKAANHIIHAELDQALMLRIDESDIHSIVMNLLGNAVQHTPSGTMVRVEWRRQVNGDAVLLIADNGPGVAADHIPHLAERFYRADPGRARSTGGTGLGLAIVKHAAERHGGTLNFSRVAGSGMSFRIAFSEACTL